MFATISPVLGQQEKRWTYGVLYYAVISLLRAGLIEACPLEWIGNDGLNIVDIAVEIDKGFNTYSGNGAEPFFCL